MLECPACGGQGCDECDDGKYAITECPKKHVGQDVWEIIEFAELYEKGLPPITGGSLDQTKSFTDACRFIWREQNYWKTKLGLF